MTKKTYIKTLAVVTFSFVACAATAQPDNIFQRGSKSIQEVLLDDFEDYTTGGLPTRWQFLRDGDLIDVVPDVNTEREIFQIENESGNRFVRAIVRDQSHRIILANEDRYDWDLETYPILRWDWRAIKLPPDAREDKKRSNDTGAAVYVYFDKDWLGRPKAIKYTYSSTLPVGTHVNYGSLHVMVASSGADGTGSWVGVERDVAADYRKLFGRRPPDRPSVIALWSDSDNTSSTAIADFDNIVLASDKR